MEMEEIHQQIASGQLIEEVHWNWVVINGKRARCINPFVHLPDAADGLKDDPFGRRNPSQQAKVKEAVIWTRSGEDRRWRNLEVIRKGDC
jgi:hypothetical protein